MFQTLGFNFVDGLLVFYCGRSLHLAGHRIPPYLWNVSSTFSVMESVWKTLKTAPWRFITLCRIAGWRIGISDQNLLESAF